MRFSVGKKVGGVYVGTSINGNSLVKGIYWFFAWPFYLAYYMLVWPFIKLYQYNKKKSNTQKAVPGRNRPSASPPNRPSGPGNKPNIVLILLCILLPFVAIPMLWLYPQWKERYSHRFRAILTIVLGIYLVFGFVVALTSEPADDGLSSSYVTASPTPSPTGTAEPLASPTPEATPTIEPTAEPTPEPTVEPTPEPTPSPTEKPAPEPTAQPSENPLVSSQGKYVGSVGSTKYHYPSCRYAENILPENEIWFDSAEDAEARGYSACKACNPK